MNAIFKIKKNQSNTKILFYLLNSYNYKFLLNNWQTNIKLKIKKIIIHVCIFSFSLFWYFK